MKPWFLVLVAVASVGCRTRLRTGDISHLVLADGETSRVIPGIPFRVRETHTVTLFRYGKESVTTLCKDGKPRPPNERVTHLPVLKKVLSARVPLPVMDKLFVLNYMAEAWADSDFVVRYMPDNSLAFVKLEGTPNAATAKAIAEQAGAVGLALAEKEQKIVERRQELEKARLALENQRLGLETTLRSRAKTAGEDYRAFHTAMAALRDAAWTYHDTLEELQLAQTLGQDVTSLEKRLRRATADIRAKMHDVNRAGALIGRSPDFPDPDALDADTIRAFAKAVVEQGL